MKSIRDIDITTKEGKLLIITLGKLCTCPGYISKTPDEVLVEMVELAKLAFKDEN
jgi:hypothetical protein